MKRILSLLLSLLLVCTLGMTVCAATGDAYTDAFTQIMDDRDEFAGYQITASVPFVWIEELHRGDSYAELVAVDHRIVGLYCDEETDRHLIFRKAQTRKEAKQYHVKQGEWYLYGQGYQSRIRALIDRFGDDFLILRSGIDTFLIFPQQPNTLYAAEQFTQDSSQAAIPYAYTLSEYIDTYAYAATRTDWTGSFEIRDELVQEAKFYWEIIDSGSRIVTKPEIQLFYFSVALLLLFVVTAIPVWYLLRGQTNQKKD